MKITNQQAYQAWLRDYPKIVAASLPLLEAGETPRDILGAMTIDGATERMLRITRQAFMHLIEVCK